MDNKDNKPLSEEPSADIKPEKAKGASAAKAKAEDKKPEKKNKLKFKEAASKFFREYKSELKKIIWYSREQTAKSTVIVVISIVAISAVIGGLDFLFAKALLWIGKLV